MAGRVLVVEDDAISRKLAQDVLQANDFVVTCVESGEAGLRALFEAPVDLIVIDIKLPGIDGLEVTRRVRSNPATAQIPVLAVTAQAMAGDEERILAAGCTAYLPKPLHFATFVATVQKLIALEGPPRAAE